MALLNDEQLAVHVVFLGADDEKATEEQRNRGKHEIGDTGTTQVIPEASPMILHNTTTLTTINSNTPPPPPPSPPTQSHKCDGSPAQPIKVG